MNDQIQYAEISGFEPSNAFAEVLHAGYEKCEPEHYASIPRDHYLLHLVLAGQGVLRVRDQIYKLRSHQCFLIRPEVAHAYQADSRHPWEYLWLGFSGVTDQTLQDVYGVPAGTSAFTPASPAKLEFHMRRILTSLQSPNPLDQLFSRALAVLALGCLGERDSGMRTKGSQPDYIDEAVSYIESHYAKLKNVQAAADYVGLERTYFSKLFQERTGISVNNFIAETRMSHAKRLLADTDYKISSIGQMVGYENYQSFERRFLNVVGMTPSQFRVRPGGERIKATASSGPAASVPILQAKVIKPEPVTKPEPEADRTQAAEETSSAPYPEIISGSRACPSYMKRKLKKS